MTEEQTRTPRSRAGAGAQRAAEPALPVWPVEELPDAPAAAGGQAAGVRRSLVRVDGELDVLTAPGLHRQVSGLIDDGVQVVVLDLAGVTFMDSSALGVLVSCLKRARAAGGQLRLCALRPQQTRLLDITGLHHVFALYATTEDALQIDVSSDELE